MDKYHQVEVIGLQETMLELTVDGKKYSSDLAQQSVRLAQATPAELKNFKLSPSGYGLHWPQLDEDLAIDPLIDLQHELPTWKVAENSAEYKTKRDES